MPVKDSKSSCNEIVARNIEITELRLMSSDRKQPGVIPLANSRLFAVSSWAVVL